MQNTKEKTLMYSHPSNKCLKTIHSHLGTKSHESEVAIPGSQPQGSVRFPLRHVDYVAAVKSRDSLCRAGYLRLVERSRARVIAGRAGGQKPRRLVASGRPYEVAVRGLC